MSEQAYFNRQGRRGGGDRKFKILIPAPAKPYTDEEFRKCLSDVYEKCLITNSPLMTPENFVELLERGLIVIQTPQGLLSFADTTDSKVREGE